MMEIFRRTTEEIEEKYGTEIAVHSLQPYLQTGTVPIFERKARKKKEVSFEEILEKHTRNVGNELLDRLELAYNSFLEVNYIATAGGTGVAWFEQIVERYKEMDGLQITIRCSQNDKLPEIYDVARGYYLFMTAASEESNETYSQLSFVIPVNRKDIDLLWLDADERTPSLSVLVKKVLRELLTGNREVISFQQSPKRAAHKTIGVRFYRGEDDEITAWLQSIEKGSRGLIIKELLRHAMETIDYRPYMIQKDSPQIEVHIPKRSYPSRKIDEAPQNSSPILFESEFIQPTVDQSSNQEEDTK